MKIALPTQENKGMESPVYGHFGSAPYFVIVDTGQNSFEVVSNGNREHLHGQCQPLAALGSKSVDAVVAGGIGPGALAGLRAAGIRVYRGVEGTVRENLALIRAGRLPEFGADDVCPHHHGGHGRCAH